MKSIIVSKLAKRGRAGDAQQAGEASSAEAAAGFRQASYSAQQPTEEERAAHAERTKREIPKVFQQYYEKAKAVVADKVKLETLLRQVEDTAHNIPGLGDVLADLVAMIDLVRAYLSNQYTQAPARTIISIAAALLYIVAPVDLIPDFVPFFGYMDDAAMVAFVYKNVHDDVEAYRAHRDIIDVDPV